MDRRLQNEPIPDPIPGPPAYFIWGEIRWHRLKTGYYQDRFGELLHREVWQQAYGPLDPKIDIHHIDENPGNNALANLAAKTRQEHKAEHPSKPKTLAQLQATSTSLLRMWAERKANPPTYNCKRCGAEYKSIQMRPSWCSLACRDAIYRERRDAKIAALRNVQPVSEDNA